MNKSLYRIFARFGTYEKEFISDDEALQYASDSVDDSPVPAIAKQINGEWKFWDTKAEAWEK